MNYLAHYERLIARARGRELSGYVERHHVLPRCMGGGNGAENIVVLTAEEHYVAHQLLVKIYPGVGGLATAAVRMAKQCTGNKAYGWLRRRSAEARRGFRHTDEARAAISGALLGAPKPPRTLEHRQNISRAKRANPSSPEARGRMGASMRGKKHSEETKKQMSLAALGKTRSPETRRRMAESKFGNKYGAGRKLTRDEIEKMAEGRRRAFAARSQA